MTANQLKLIELVGVDLQDLIHRVEAIQDDTYSGELDALVNHLKAASKEIETAK